MKIRPESSKKSNENQQSNLNEQRTNKSKFFDQMREPVDDEEINDIHTIEELQSNLTEYAQEAEIKQQNHPGKARKPKEFHVSRNYQKTFIHLKATLLTYVLGLPFCFKRID